MQRYEVYFPCSSYLLEKKEVSYYLLVSAAYLPHRYAQNSMKAFKSVKFLKGHHRATTLRQP